MSMVPPFQLTDANGFFEFGDGSNIQIGTNPAYAVSDFLAFYPQFGPNSLGTPVVPTAVLQTFITLACTVLQQSRWQSMWALAVGWYVAHFCTLYLQSMADPDGGAAAVFASGRSQGVIMSKSVGDVSVSYDPNLSGRDQPSLAGWGAFHLTVYGQQLITSARLVGKGGMYIY
jgi:hypothetical protein